MRTLEPSHARIHCTGQRSWLTAALAMACSSPEEIVDASSDGLFVLAALDGTNGEPVVTFDHLCNGVHSQSTIATRSGFVPTTHWS